MKFPTYEIEQEKIDSGFRYVVGVDESGRGPGAGPVVSAAVHIPQNKVDIFAGKVNDSKKVSPKKREALYDVIMEHCLVGVESIDAEVIDKINILEATKLAMRNAIQQLGYYDYILVDGLVDLSEHLPDVPLQKIIKGDALSISIAADSIIAKVTRDRMMLELHKKWPIYDFENNKGYLTKSHIEAINTYGITEHHRVSFRKVGR